MSKRNLIIIILFLSTAFLGWLLFMYFSGNKTTTTTSTETTTEFPFGKTNTTNNTGLDGDNEAVDLIISKRDEGGVGETKTIFKQIYSKPTSGSIFYSNKNKILRFVDREKGNIYEYDTNKQEEPVRTTNTTIAKIQDTQWSKNSNNLILSFLDDENNINNFSGKIKISTSTEGTVGEITTEAFLTKNSIQSIINPSGDKIFELINKPGKSGSYGVISSTKAENKKQIFDSPLSLFNINWINDNIITFTTKPSYKDDGILFFFNIKSNTFDKIFGSIKGLTTNTNETGDLVAYSETKNKDISLNVYDVIKREIIKLDISTIADKCVWSTKNTKKLYCAIPKEIIKNQYPDVWYQGLVSFSDNIWFIDTESGSTKLIFDIDKEKYSDIDAFNLKLSDDDKYLSLINKNDLSLWLLEITENNPATTTIKTI